MLVAPSDRCSSLRGLSATTSASGGGGENNLAFKCTRKRLVIETLHLDLEGGVSERRTTPVAPVAATRGTKSSAGVEHIAVGADEGAGEQPKKKKKAVAFRSDRPDLYDF
jgi:elongator complex protein 4